MSKERTVISIWVNMQDEMEKKMLDHVHAKGNRSKYLKKLIYDDLMEVRNLITATTHYENDIINEDTDAMKGFL